MKFEKVPVLVAGDDRTAFSIAVCLLQAGHDVTLLTSSKGDALTAINAHLSHMAQEGTNAVDLNGFEIVESIGDEAGFYLAIVVTAEELDVKRSTLQRLEDALPVEALIAINSESIPLSDIQKGCRAPDRIIGVNWVEPAHTTFFMEIISNDFTRKDILDDFVAHAKGAWQKDPYVLENGAGIRSRMMSAMVREAFYLLENDYVSIEDIDRACRNDPGYYLPFSGHCRYMDLMGTYIYGAVMKDLNPELSKDTHIPDFFTKIIAEGAHGVATGRGFYVYRDKEVEKRLEEFRKFSYEIRHIISKYPFNYLKEQKYIHTKVASDL